MLPEAIVVISVLKESFSDEEKVLLKDFAERARTSENYRPRHWVILLTGTALFAEHHISSTWKEKGEPYRKFSEYHFTKSLTVFSDATQAIYLGMPSYSSWRIDQMKQK